MSLLGRRRERAEAEDQARRLGRLVMQPHEARFGRLHGHRWLYLCWWAHRLEVPWTDEEALGALAE
jgi:hypothetical protein